jgi:phage recombination protein Bet
MANGITYLTRNSPGVSQRYTPAQLDLIRTTVCARLTSRMFDQFMETSERLRLDPLKKQVVPIVFRKREFDAQSKKWVTNPYLTIITTIDGYRAIADRTGNYRPDTRTPRYVYDEAAKNPATNPLGIVSCEVSVFKHAHGDWHEHTAVAFWDEYVPLKKPDKPSNEGMEEYEQPAGPVREFIDPGTQWGRRPRGQIAKCAEALACRRCWPEDFSGVYVEEEMDRARIIEGEFEDMTPSAMAEKAAVDRRLEVTNLKDQVIVDWMKPDHTLEPVPVGQLADRCLAFIEENAEEVSVLATFQDRNRHSLREFYARSPTDAHAVKQAFEKAIASGRQRAEASEPSLPLETGDAKA